MNGERWERISEIFYQAGGRAPAERDAFLREVCAGDPDLYGAVRTLVDRDAGAGRALEGIVHAAMDRLTGGSPAGSPVGSYRIIQEPG